MGKWVDGHKIVVRNSEEQLTSYVPTLYALVYEPRKIIVPKIGKIFFFMEFEYAYEYWQYLEDNSSTEIWKVRAFNPSIINRIPFAGEFDIHLFWTYHQFSSNMVMYPPLGTYVCEKICLLEQEVQTDS